MLKHIDEKKENILYVPSKASEDPADKPKKKFNTSDFNRKFALKATAIFGSMATFYAFCVWACLPLIPTLSKQKDLILYISSGFIQLVALPLILVGQNIMNALSEKRAERTLVTVENTSKSLEQIVKDLGNVNTILSKKMVKNIESTTKMQTDIVKIQTKLADDISSLKKYLKIEE